MTLDSWIARGLSQSEPPAKRLRRDELVSEANGTCLSPRSRPQVTPSPPPQFTREAAKGLLRETWPPEYLYGRRDLLSWYASQGFYDSAYPYSLACLPDSPHAVIGLETGEIHVIQCGTTNLGLYDPSVGRATSVVQSPGDYDSPVRDLAPLGHGNLISASDSGIHITDLNHGGSSTMVAKVLDVCSLCVHAYHGQTLAFGTSSGSLGLIDLRERVPRICREWKDAHAVLAGPRAQRVRHGITAAAWYSDTVVSTASNANESVKFWDVRSSSRKQPLHCTTSRTTGEPRRKGEGGIISLVGSHSQPGMALWGLNRLGELIKIGLGSYTPEYRLRVPNMRVNCRYASIDVIPDQSATNPATGHRAPQWPLIACGGQNGVTVVTEPSSAARQLDVNACLAARLPCGGATDVTKVKWHPYTNELISVADDKTCRLWALDPRRRVPAQYLPPSDLASQHRPKRLSVRMAPHVYH